MFDRGIVTRRAALSVGLGAALPVFAIRRARAEATRLRLARQYGVTYVQFTLLEDQKLVEKHAADAGLGPVEVTWNTFRSSDVMNDALLSGGIDIASLGVSGLAIIWDRTAGARTEVKGMVGLNVGSLSLVTREPEVKTIADFRSGMKIAMPAVKVSNQAIFLEMAAAKQWGKEAYARLDPLTVTMAHPDAVVALLAGNNEIGSYFGSTPFPERALKAPGVREVTNSAAILGSPASMNVLATPTRFYNENPRLMRAFLAAMAEATDSINRDKAAAAATYARLTGDKTPIPELAEVMTKDLTYTLDVQNTLPIMQFMSDAGILRHRAQAWTDYMLPSAAARAGG